MHAAGVVDDATSRLMAVRFVETESAFAYFAATQGYLERHGKPVAFYSDKHSVFCINQPLAVGGCDDGMTQFGLCLHTLNIDITAPTARRPRAARNAPTRPCKTGQSRSCACKASTAGNAMLPAFMADYNARFAKEPHDATPPVSRRPPRRRVRLARGAHRLGQPHAPVRQGAVPAGADARRQGP